MSCLSLEVMESGRECLRTLAALRLMARVEFTWVNTRAGGSRFLTRPASLLLNGVSVIEKLSCVVLRPTAKALSMLFTAETSIGTKAKPAICSGR